MPESKHTNFNGISIILPVYNGIAYLRESIQSLLDQDFGEYEVLISDDCSKDGSREVLLDFEKKHGSRLKVYYQDVNLGLFANLNFLIRQSRYPLIHLWSQDDIMEPNCIRETLAFHNTHPDISMSYSDRDYIDEHGTLLPNSKVDGTPAVISPGLYARISVRWGCIAGNIANVTLVRSYLDRYGFFNESLRVSGDFELFTRLSAQSHIGFINKKLILLRRHTGQLSRKASSSYYFIKEDIPIIRSMLGRLDAEEQKSAKRFWIWKTQVIYMNELVSLLRKRHLSLALKVGKLMRKEFNIILVFLRWTFVRSLRFMKKDKWFYQVLENR